MKKFLSIFALSLLLMAWGCEADESTGGPISVQYVIYYTSSDGQIVNPKVLDFGANLIGNSYSDNQGVLMFDAPITSIGNSAFSSCSRLTTITIPYSVQSIGGWAFEKCSSLTSVTIPDSVTSIGRMAFYNCSSLESVTIGNSVTSIEERAFYYCSSLTAFNGKFASKDNRCLIIDNTLIAYANASGATYTIPDSVTSIGESAFDYCSSLTSVTIPDSVTSIGGFAFRGCDSLTSVTIPDSVTSIGEYAFAFCYSLESITIPDSVTSIGANAFSGCTSLTSVTIPDSVTSIGEYAFSYCNSLTSVYCKPTTPPTGGKYMFSHYDYKPIGCYIYVPTASVSAYKAKQYWSDYADYIVGYDF